MFEEDQKLVRGTNFQTSGVGPLVIAEGDPASDAGLGLRPGFPSVQIDAFIFQGPPEARYVEGMSAFDGVDGSCSRRRDAPQ